MKVLFFAQSRQAAGCTETYLKVERPIDPAELWDRLIQSFSGLEPLRKTARLARGEAYLSAEARLQPDDEIAVIPAVSGG